MSLLFSGLIIFAPLYVWRFQLVGLPTNFLMLYAGLVLLIGIIDILWRGKLGEYISVMKTLPKTVAWFMGLFFIASVISLFVNGVDVAKIGQWIVLYVLPIGLAKLLYYYIKTEVVSRQALVRSLYIFLFAAGLIAIAQYFFLWGLPQDFWGNSAEPKRAIGFFAHPNGFSLFITPLLAYLLPNVKMRVENFSRSIFTASNFWILAWGLGASGLLLSLSRGGWLGLVLAAAVFVLWSSSKKMLLVYGAAAIVAVAVLLSIPNFRYRILLPFHGEKSTVARFSLWETGSKMIKDSPILGQGINGFNYNWDRYNTDPNLQHYNFPHNFILNTWIDTGLLGLLSWLGIVGWGLWFGLKNKSKPYAFGLALCMIAILAHGLIDIPYFKNDLALLFWLLFALSV